MDFFRFLIGVVVASVTCVADGSARAQGKTTSLLVAPEVQETGVVKFMLPRFTLKHGVRVTVVTEGDAAGSLIKDGEAAVFSRAGDNYGLTVHRVDDPHMATLAAWLTGDVGQRTVLSFKRDGQAVFEVPIVVVEAAVEAELDGDAARGAELALSACGRCHVVGDVNRMNGIGSTPSFAVLRSLDGWMERFWAFYALNPHPSFTIIPDVTEPFDETRPSPISPVTVTLEELENIVAYTATMAPANLGAPVVHQ
ncbi:hypothetical protein [uncultured Shimia sp.]|uniref:hypothetical protein n=1 Tax=uncultured Shimia sp. TaxID=573152 RepID=UPI00261810EE|nr:hypothetical protein [uncultured Shimia sp.]